MVAMAKNPYYATAIIIQCIKYLYLLVYQCCKEKLVMRLSRKRKASLKARVMEMNDARIARRRSELAKRTPETPEISSIALSNELSEDLPAPIHEANNRDECSSQEDDSYECTLSDNEISAIYSDWISDMERVHLQKTAMMVYDNYIKRFNLTKTGAAKEVGLLFGIHEKTVRRWRKEFLSSGGDFTEDGRGRHDRYHIMMDEEYREKALEWVRSQT